MQLLDSWSPPLFSHRQKSGCLMTRFIIVRRHNFHSGEGVFLRSTALRLLYHHSTASLFLRSAGPYEINNGLISQWPETSRYFDMLFIACVLCNLFLCQFGILNFALVSVLPTEYCVSYQKKHVFQ